MKRLLLVLLLLSYVGAADILSHDIKITLEEDGSAYVEEFYTLRLSESEVEQFKKTAEGSTSWYNWGSFGIGKTITRQSQDEVASPYIAGSDIAKVSLQYFVPEIVQPVEKHGRFEHIGITEEEFTWYDGEHIELPYNPPTELEIFVANELDMVPIVVPPAREITESGAGGEGYTVYKWSYTQPFKTQRFRLLYKREASIQSQLSPRAIWSDLEEKLGTPIYAMALGLLVIIAFWYRSQIMSLVGEAFESETMIEEGEE